MTNQNLQYAQMLLEAKETLISGGVVDIAADGLRGFSDNIQVPFHGRLRNFKATFAHLALMTEAALVPVVLEMDIKGYMKLNFLEPLSIPSAEKGEEAQIRELVVAYAKNLEQIWADFPWLVRALEMKSYLDELNYINDVQMNVFTKL